MLGKESIIVLPQPTMVIHGGLVRGSSEIALLPLAFCLIGLVVKGNSVMSCTITDVTAINYYG